MREIAAILFALSLVGCATKAPVLITPDALTMPINSLEIISGAKDCQSPISPKEKLSRRFKYGCFCGKDYPALRHSSGRQGLDLSLAERAELVKAFLEVRPLDAIDSACQKHDICWVRFGNSQLSCNKEFIAELDNLSAGWKERISFFDVKSLEFRCQFLARDLSFATMTVMQGDAEDQGELAATNLTKLIGFPITALYAISTFLGGAIGGSYPTAGERCVAP